MNLNDQKYSSYALVREMMDTIRVVSEFNRDAVAAFAPGIKNAGRLLLTGEGSSRIFPAKNTIRKSLSWGLGLNIFTDGSRQSAQYDLSKMAVFCASNSGKTKEVVLLAQKLRDMNNPNRFGLCANAKSLLEEACAKTHILSCGAEQAVAATKSVVEQALFYELIVRYIAGTINTFDGSQLANKLEAALTMPVSRDIVKTAVNARTIYFAGHNDGVAEELTLKTNEITRKKSDFLEGTYAVHGIEEVMEASDIVFVVDPIDEEADKFHEVLEKGVGLKVVAIANRPTRFETIQVPDAGEFNPYVYLCAGWNVLVEIGLAAGINLDKPQRARKVGNELII